MKSKNNTLRRWIAVGIAVLLFTPVTAVVLCADTGEGPVAYRYDPEGKPDPFKPLIHVVERDTKVAPRSPLQRLAVDEFLLMGIVRTADTEVAIVKTPGGKWYTLRTGTRIGINDGRVVKILSDSVVVSEKIKDFSGAVHTERTILVLKKNGGNP